MCSYHDSTENMLVGMRELHPSQFAQVHIDLLTNMRIKWTNVLKYNIIKEKNWLNIFQRTEST